MIKPSAKRDERKQRKLYIIREKEREFITVEPGVDYAFVMRDEQLYVVGKETQ